ncbi:MAG TPA: tRNA (adenosine(37)-N6)-dimethylallyltransferase MiaA [Terriglobales bacterium]|nr:tRNA (adenosine(37)-N6)-dimethylallyltransferase MiaA [Terriglobales bacterium]
MTSSHTSSEDTPLLVIAGPTGSGKTALSLAMAERFGGEIVSCDSVAVYREFDIGTAKPSPEQRTQVPHHMIDVASPEEMFTAGEYARQARAALQEIKLRKKVPIVVGGTGLYLRALLEGLFAGPPRSEEIRARLQKRSQQKGAGHLYRLLRRMDQEAAAGIHANDTPKLIRAIEICLTAREKMTDLWKTGRDPLTGFRIVQVGLDPERSALYARINERCRRMFVRGLVEEARALLAKYPQTLTVPNSPLNSLGYRQAVQVIRGELTQADAISAAQQAHRNYAKRQLTWFRRDPAIRWVPAFGDEDPALEATAQALDT